MTEQPERGAAHPLMQPGDTALCEECGDTITEHGQEQDFYPTESKREVCLKCPGYEEPGYPNGKAWHRFRPVGVQGLRRRAMSQQQTESIIEQMWRELCMTKKPCPCHHLTGHESRTVDQPCTCQECKGTGKVWLLPGLQQECKGNVQSSSTALHELCCDGSGWLPIEFDAVKLMVAISKVLPPFSLYNGHADEGDYRHLWFLAFKGQDVDGIVRTTDPKETLVRAAYKALGLEGERCQ